MPKDRQLYNILVVEDNPGDFLLIEDFLHEQMQNLAIVQVRDFRSAVDFFKNSKQLPDVVLLDLTLPDNGGEELIDQMMKVAQPVPIIILTGLADIVFSKKSIALGISDYLVKDELNATMLYKSILYALERTKNLAAMRESEKKYSELFNLSPQAMWVYDLETFMFLQVNKAAIERYGYSEEEFLQMTILDIRTKSEQSKVENAIRGKSAGNNVAFSGQFVHKKKSGALVTVEVYSTPILINNRLCRSAIAIDVTEKIEFEHKVTRAIIKTQEEERYEIGGELHDNVCQILAASMMSLEVLKLKIGPETEKHFNATRSYIRMATDEIRNLSHRLAPAFYDESSFEEAIEGMIKNLDLRNRFDLNFMYSKSLNSILFDKELQLNLYRILQEALRNTLKYADAKTLCIRLWPENNELLLQIADDGKGFTLTNIKSGIGLANMKRRAELFGGSFDITSAPGEGASITVRIPVNQKKYK
ncbi:MAG: hypothetical protein JWQ27_2336 [Ferruginibacter sp.]|nr:hypothetical protein [Ferruginibacter sp.]